MYDTLCINDGRSHCWQRFVNSVSTNTKTSNQVVFVVICGCRFIFDGGDLAGDVDESIMFLFWPAATYENTHNIA